MSDASTSHPPLLQTRTGGATIFSSLLILIGLGGIAYQIIIATNGSMDSMGNGVRLLPGLIGAVFSVMGAFLSTRKGQLDIYRNRIKGRKQNGAQVDLALDEVGEILLHSRMLILKNKEGRLLFVESKPQNPDTRGLIWLLLRYADLPDKVWNSFSQSATDNFRPARRQFLDGQDSAEFVDAGIIAEVED
ncbi:MAG: hypothetical protein AAF570_25980, partial [Bacteroidota bacterium]